MTLLKKFFNIQKGEGFSLSILFFSYFLLIGSIIIGKTARDTFFLSRYNPDLLPYMFIIGAVLLAVFVVPYTYLTKQYSRKLVIIITGFLFMLSLLIIHHFLHLKIIYPILYIWIDILAALMIPQFWLLANDFYTTRQAKRLFGIISSGAAISNLIIGFSLKTFSQNFHTDLLLPIAACLVFISSILFLLYNPTKKTENQILAPIKNQKNLSIKKLFNNPYTLTIAFVIGISTIVVTFIDFQFKMIISDSLNETQMAGTFATMYGYVGLASIIIQLLATSRLLSFFGILPCLSILPIALFAGSISIFLIPSVLTACLARSGDLTFRFTINDTTSQLLWLPVSQKEKNITKPLIDGPIKNSAQGLAGILIIVLMMVFDFQFLSIISVVLIAAWFCGIVKLKKGYVKSLNNAIEKRQLNFDSIPIDYTDPQVVDSIRSTLIDGDDFQILFALETIKNLPLLPWNIELLNLFDNGSTTIKKEVLKLAGLDKKIFPDKKILGMLDSDENWLCSEAMVLCGKRKIKDSYQFILSELNSDDPVLKSRSAVGIILLNETNSPDAEEVIRLMLLSSEEKHQIAVLSVVGHIPDKVSIDDLSKLLLDKAIQVRKHAIHFSSHKKNEELIPLLMQNLLIPALTNEVISTLKNHRNEMVTIYLNSFLKKNYKHLPNNIFKYLSIYANSETIDILLNNISFYDDHTAKSIADSLLIISRSMSLTENQMKITENKMNLNQGRLEKLTSLLNAIKPAGSNLLMIDLIQNRFDEKRFNFLKMAMITEKDIKTDSVVQSLKSSNSDIRSNAIEILDNSFTREIREVVLSLFEQDSLSDNTNDVPATLEGKNELLLNWVYSDNTWHSAITLDFIISSGQSNLLANLQWDKIPKTHIHKEVMNKYLEENNAIIKNLINFPEQQFNLETKPMYSTLEKTIFLKGVDLFKHLPGEEVGRIAQIAEEVEYGLSETIFEEGELGMEMFIIMEGEIEIHKEKRQLAILKNGQFMGEMALLDQEPRSASAKATSNSILLKINREDFYDLMKNRMDIMQGIIKVLTSRLRKAIA